MNEKVEICAEIKHETKKAFLINDSSVEAWMPKSQVEMDQDGGVGDTVVFTMDEWLAIEKGFV